MPFVEAQFLRDPDQVAALFRLPGIAAGETKPGPARAEAGSAAAAGDPFAATLSPFNKLQAMNGNVRIRLCASPGVPQQAGRPGRLRQLVQWEECRTTRVSRNSDIDVRADWPQMGKKYMFYKLDKDSKCFSF